MAEELDFEELYGIDEDLGLNYDEEEEEEEEPVYQHPVEDEPCYDEEEEQHEEEQHEEEQHEEEQQKEAAAVGEEPPLKKKAVPIPSPAAPKDKGASRLATRAIAAAVQDSGPGGRGNMRERNSDVCYFIIRSHSTQNLDMSVQEGAWATQPHNEEKLNQAFRSCKEVRLLFSINASGHFQGWAVMRTEVGNLGRNVHWGGKTHFGQVFGVEWKMLCDLSYQLVEHLKNPLNENKPVKLARDGQEVPKNVGDQLVKLFEEEAARAGVNSPHGEMHQRMMAAGPSGSGGQAGMHMPGGSMGAGPSSMGQLPQAPQRRAQKGGARIVFDPVAIGGGSAGPGGGPGEDPGGGPVGGPGGGPSGPGGMGAARERMGGPMGGPGMSPPLGLGAMGPPLGPGAMGPPLGPGTMGPPLGPGGMGLHLGPGPMGPPPMGPGAPAPPPPPGMSPMMMARQQQQVRQLGGR
eukprot:gene23802-9364_t